MSCYSVKYYKSFPCQIALFMAVHRISRLDNIPKLQKGTSQVFVQSSKYEEAEEK